MHSSKLGFIVRPKYVDTFLPNAFRVDIGHFRVSFHQLEIENGHANGVPIEERIRRLHYINLIED